MQNSGFHKQLGVETAAFVVFVDLVGGLCLSSVRPELGRRPRALLPRALKQVSFPPTVVPNVRPMT